MLAKLETGLTKAQVRFIMGTPSIRDPFNSDRWDYIGFQIVGDEKNAVVHLVINFKDNKLIEFKTITENEVNENLKEKSIIESTKKLER